MADIELVIRIPEKEYQNVMRGRWEGNPLANYIENGTPLPKGHGRLIDANKLCEGRVSNDTVVIVAKCAQTIIEADKKYEVEVITRGNCMICGKELTEGLLFCKECGDKVSNRK